jgi:hypothetical protein
MATPTLSWGRPFCRKCSLREKPQLKRVFFRKEPSATLAITPA